MSRVIHTDGVGKRRQRLLQMIGVALRELMTQTAPDERTLDLATFIAELLAAVADTVEETTAPWEKRDYWLKADRFRRQWQWAGQLSAALRGAVLAKDWDEIARLAAQVFAHVGHVKIPKRLRLGNAWEGSYRRLLAEEAGQQPD